MDRSGGPDAFFLTLPVATSALEDARLALLAYLEPFDLAPRVINRLEVVLEELVTNVVRHATGADSLSIEAEYRDGTVWLAIEDNGPAFNPLDVPEPAPFASLEDAVVGGQGIPLIRRLSKTVSYERIGRTNRMTSVIAG